MLNLLWIRYILSFCTNQFCINEMMMVQKEKKNRDISKMSRTQTYSDSNLVRIFSSELALELKFGQIH